MVKHPLKKKQPTDKLAAGIDRIAVVRVWQIVVTPSLVTVMQSSMKEYRQACQQFQFLRLWELWSRNLPCVYPSKLTLNEINKFRLNWQLTSKVITLPLMSLHWNRRRLGLHENSTGVARRSFPTQRSDEWWQPEFTCQGFYTLTHTYTHTQHSHMLTPSSSNS